jgi:membrane-bound lytic murein transglycosylase B
MKRLLFLTISTAILTAALFLTHAFSAVQAQRDMLVRELDAATRAQAELEQRNRELEEALLSRGGRQDDATATVTRPSGFSAAMLERCLAGTELEGLGSALVQAEKATGINALVLAGIIAHESGWGRSRIAKEKNNLAGLGTYDHSPGSAICFESRAECVMFLAELLRERPGSLEEIGTWYAIDPRWAEKVAGCMKMIAEAGR